MNPNNLTIAPKLGIVVGVAQLGLCVAVALAAYLLQREMPSPAILGLGILCIATSSGIIAWVFGRSVSGPLGQLAARMRALADGELQAHIPGIGRTDELGTLAATVLMLNDHAVRTRGTEKAEVDAQQRAVAERRTAMQTLAKEFERSVSGIVRARATPVRARPRLVQPPRALPITSAQSRPRRSNCRPRWRRFQGR